MRARRESYDVVIIGAGIGGLVCGNFLARKGLSVLICEQHTRPGGYVCGFRRKGFYFDGGVQSFSSSGLFFPILAKLGLLGETRFSRAYFRLTAPDVDVVVRSLEDVESSFLEAYPGAKEGLEKFFSLLGDLVEAMGNVVREPNPWVEEGLGRVTAALSLIPKIGSLRKFRLHRGERAADLMRRYIEDERPRRLLSSLGYPNSSVAAYAGM